MPGQNSSVEFSLGKPELILVRKEQTWYISTHGKTALAQNGYYQSTRLCYACQGEIYDIVVNK
jgi:hypothetical protein